MLFCGLLVLRTGGQEALFAILRGTAPDACVGAEAHWKSAESIGTIDAFEDHLAHFGNCAFASLAIKRINTIRSDPPPQPPKTPVPINGSRHSDSEPCGETFKGKNSDGVPEYTLNFDCKRDAGQRRPDESGDGWDKPIIER